MPEPPITRTKLASKTPTLAAGDAAPEIGLKSHDGREIGLTGLRGKKAVIAFFHFAFTNT